MTSQIYTQGVMANIAGHKVIAPRLRGSGSLPNLPGNTSNRSSSSRSSNDYDRSNERTAEDWRNDLHRDAGEKYQQLIYDATQKDAAERERVLKLNRDVSQIKMNIINNQYPVVHEQDKKDIKNLLKQIQLKKPFLSPEQKESELKKSKIAYNLAVEKINNYEKNKTKLGEEIKDLTAKIEGTNKLIIEYQKDSAKLEYQQTVVWYEATNHGSEMEKSVVTKRENNLKNTYGLSDEEIKQLRDVAKSDLKQGVPTLKYLKSSELENYDTEGAKQDYSQHYDKEKDKVVEIEGSKTLDIADAGLSGLEAGTYIAAGIIEGAYSNAKLERAETIKKQKENVKSFTGSINVKKQQITDMTIEYNNLKKVFDKYGYDIINDTDEYHIIDFGNACKNTLNIRIE
jgi:hypothetical protein